MIASPLFGRFGCSAYTRAAEAEFRFYSGENAPHDLAQQRGGSVWPTDGHRASALRIGLAAAANSVTIAAPLAAAPSNRVYMAGCEFRSPDDAAFDAPAFETIARFKVDCAIPPASAIDPARSVKAHERREAEMSRLTMEIAAHRICAVDGGKFGESGLIIKLVALPHPRAG